MTYQADGGMLEASHEPNVVVEPLENVAYVYDGSTEGLLTAVFKTYAFHEQPQDIFREGALQPRLGQNRFAPVSISGVWQAGQTTGFSIAAPSPSSTAPKISGMTSLERRIRTREPCFTRFLKISP